MQREVTISGKFGQGNLFWRAEPAAREGPPEVWELVRTVVDHGCFIFENVNNVRPESGVRDVVIAAIFRRILITGEAVRVLLTIGLEEPAVATFRTLLDLEVNLRLVLADDSDETARRLGLFFFVQGRRHFRRVTRDVGTREDVQGDEVHWEWLTRTSRAFKGMLDHERFKDIREEVERGRYWHGQDSVADAFEAAGMLDDYNLVFDPLSMFVHASNIEQDLSDADEGGVHLTPFVQRDPARNFTPLQGLTLKLIDLYNLILEDKGNPTYQEAVTVTEQDGSTSEMHPLNALSYFVLDAFRDYVAPHRLGAEVTDADGDA